METLYKGQPADVWEITKTGAQPDWVKDAFSQNYLYWLDNRGSYSHVGVNPT